MEIFLYDERVKPSEPGFDTGLGQATGVSLERDGRLHILAIKTELAYYLTIKLTKADLEELRERLTATSSKEKR